MPLLGGKKAKTKAGISQNIRTEMKAGKKGAADALRRLLWERQQRP